MKFNYILLGIASIIVILVMSAKKKEAFREGQTTWRKIANEGERARCNGIARFGKGSQWTTRLWSGGEFQCDSGTFPYPRNGWPSGVRKECQCAPRPRFNSAGPGYTKCADKNGNCSCKGFVKYGKWRTWTGRQYKQGNTKCISSSFPFAYRRGDGEAECQCRPYPARPPPPP